MMRKKIIISIIIFFIFIPSLCFATETTDTQEIMNSQSESLGISDFISQAQKYTQDTLDMNVSELFNSAIKGEVDNSKILSKILNIFGDEIKTAFSVLGSILVVIIIHSILRSISDSLNNSTISQIAYYTEYILIVTLIMTNFATIVNMTKDTIGNLVGFSYTLIPLMITLMIATGSIVSASVVQPVILFLITFIGNIINSVILPIALISTAIAIVSKISDKVQIDKLSKFFKSSVVWVLGVILTIFVGVLSLEGSLTSNVDGITAKTVKAAVSNVIPVVGKILGDSVDTVLGCSSILKNATGVIGIIIIIGICVMPIIKLTILTIAYHLAAAICQPIADEKIISLLSQMGDTFKILLAILCSVAVMLIIGVTLALKISNSGLMYR